MPIKPTKRNDLSVEEFWGHLSPKYTELVKVARNMARIDDRLDGDDLLQTAIVDMAECRHQWDMARAFKPWAVTRIWKARTYALRRLNELDRFHKVLGHRVHVIRSDDGDLADPMLHAALDVGMWGTADRTEAVALINEILQSSEPEVAIMLRCILQGRRSRKLPKLSTEQLAVRVGSELGFIPVGGTHERDPGSGSAQCLLPLARPRAGGRRHEQVAR